MLTTQGWIHTHHGELNLSLDCRQLGPALKAAVGLPDFKPQHLQRRHCGLCWQRKPANSVLSLIPMKVLGWLFGGKAGCKERLMSSVPAQAQTQDSRFRLKGALQGWEVNPQALFCCHLQTHPFFVTKNIPLVVGSLR